MIYLLLSFASAYALWVFFLAAMNLIQARDEGALPTWAHRLGLPVILVGIVIDVVVQLTIACVIFLELPHEMTVSGRVKRWVEGPKFIGYPDGPPTKGLRWWRYSVALWMRLNLLKPFDRTGGHG
jgi:amino acid transporter